MLGSDKGKFKDGENSNIDVFTLGEGDSRQAINYSIGGVIRSNSVQYIDYINTSILEIRKDNEDVFKDFYYILKENISLKELDYRLRERAIKQYGSCSNSPRQGQVIIAVNDGTIHTIDLSQRLGRERMGESVDDIEINKTLVEME